MSMIPLSDEQKQKIAGLARNAPELIVHRARLILAYAAGKPTLQAALEAGISRGRARFWKRQFLARGMDIFTLDSIAGKSTLLPVKAAQDGSKASGGPTGKVMAEASPAVEDAIPYPQPREAIGLGPEDCLADAGVKVWLFHFALMLCHEEGTLKGEDNEELHDMRVATRRMRTAFDVFGPAFDPKIMRHYLKGLRTVGKALGKVRDMDVILGQALDYRDQLAQENQPGLDPLISAWKQVIAKKRLKMTRHLQSEDYRAFKHEFNAFLQTPGSHGDANDGAVMNTHLRDVVPALIYSRYAAVRGYEAILPSASVAQLHALRIEYKKFRYVLEYFREILGEPAGKAINEIKQYQDHLGELHDTDVACQLVSDFLQGWEEEQLDRPIHVRQNPEPIVTYLAHLHAERYRLVSGFPEMWVKFSRPEFRQNIAQAIIHL